MAVANFLWCFEQTQVLFLALIFAMPEINLLKVAISLKSISLIPFWQKRQSPFICIKKICYFSINKIRTEYP